MKFSELMGTVLTGEQLDFATARAWMDSIMDGELDEAQIGGLLVALRARGESPEEIAGFARSMRDHSRGLDLDDEYRPLVDTCGTGGDKLDTFNISTLSALVATAGGARVAKHGNRSVSSSCGSADLLEALGVEIELPPAAVEACIREVGIGFMFAPTFHLAMKHAIGPRKSLGIRTVFNLLGPLTNPARADRQLLGVFGPEWVRPVAEALRTLGVEKALVVHGLDGLDEISLSQATKYAELDGDSIEGGVFEASDFGVETIQSSEIAGGDSQENRQLADRLLDGKATEPVEDIVCVNAGAVLYLADRAHDLRSGVELARECIKNGQARETLEYFVEFTQRQAREIDVD